MMAEPRRFANINHALYQAKLWRRYAMDWTSKDYFRREWVRHVLRVPRDECLRRSREAVMAARRLNDGEE